MSSCYALTFEVTVPQFGDVPEMTSEGHKVKMKENRHCLIKIIESLQYHSWQGLALRGDQSDEDFNFMQLLKLGSKDFSKLKQWLITEKCTSHDIQNEILMLMAHQILRNLAEEIRGSFYALMCDEYTDISSKEQLTLCLRWIDDCFSVYEDVLGFYEVLNTKSGTIVSVIKDVLLRTQISLEKYGGQCCDGATNMLGKKSGVAK